MTMATPKKMKTLRVDLATHAEITKRAHNLGLQPARFLTLAMREGDAVENLALDQLAKAAEAERRRRGRPGARQAAPAPSAPASNAPAQDRPARQ